MRAIWTLARKDFALLLRDRQATLLLLVMPLLFILVLGLLVGDDFGQQSKLRISLVDLDVGQGPRASLQPSPGEPWALTVRHDLEQTAGINVEIVGSLEEARDLVEFHKRAAVVVFEADFSDRVDHCSFLHDGINPFYRDGVKREVVRVDLLKDAKQPASSAIVEQVVQVALLRVLMPWMISQAFARLSDQEFIDLLSSKVRLPVPPGGEFLFTLKGIKLQDGKVSLNDALQVAARNPQALKEYRDKVGAGVQEALKEQFSKFNLLGKTWADLTKGAPGTESGGAEESPLSSRGAARYQVLVPANTVMFAFFLVLIVGRMFVAERQQGTLKRLRAAPVTRGQVLLGKLLPCFALSVSQGFVLLLAGRLNPLWNMRWGPDSWSLGHQLLYLAPVVFCTSLAAMGLALLVAALARTEMQVLLYGAVPVLILALIGGCVLPREMMPEQAQVFTFLAPQGWALEAYRELLGPDGSYIPNLVIVRQACLVLAGFGVVFLAIAWALLRLE